MNQHTDMAGFGRVDGTTLTIERRLPGTIERVWAYLTEGDLRRKWLAAGDMELKTGARFEFIWRNDELTLPPGQRPEGFAEELRMEGDITDLDPPCRLSITWGSTGGVTIELAAQGDHVLLKLVHKRLPDRDTLLLVGAGWHMHLDILRAILDGQTPPSFWDGWSRLRAEYDRRLPA